ncbi:hypothetical protein BC628DRAFT_1421068 [Trametes gibbosa]|nr:hypothetical protein BC628DRAFT_1421068 [Trametes gibbosa]
MDIDTNVHDAAYQSTVTPQPRIKHTPSPPVHWNGPPTPASDQTPHPVPYHPFPHLELVEEEDEVLDCSQISSLMSFEETREEDIGTPRTRSPTPMVQSSQIMEPQMESIALPCPHASIDPRPPSDLPLAATLDAFLKQQLTMTHEAQTQQLQALTSLTATLCTGITMMAQEITLLREDAQKARQLCEHPRRARGWQRTRIPQHPQ